jgi:hypothetical protein
MTKTGYLFVGLVVALAACIAMPASAGTAAYVARAGSGTTCTLAAPCSSMTAAIPVAGLAGEVICLDKGSYSGATFTQTITISCGDDFWEAPGGQIVISTPAGSSVTIEGLVIDAIGSTGTAVFF